MSSLTETELKKLKLAELKKMCADLDLQVSGTKSDLIDRILCHDAKKPIVTVQPDEEAKLLDDDDDLIDNSSTVGTESLDEAPKGSVDSEDKEALDMEAPMKVGEKRSASDQEKTVEGSINPAKIAVVDTDPKTAPSQASAASGTSKLKQEERIALRSQRFGSANADTTTTTISPPTSVTSGGRVLDEDKKLERAHRFGLPINFASPKSDEEKRQARAQRFNEPAPSNLADKSPPADPAAAEERKRRRLEKFGTVISADETKTSPPVAAVDPSVVEKKKAERAARFGLPIATAATAKVSTGVSSDGDTEKLRKRAERFGISSVAN